MKIKKFSEEIKKLEKTCAQDKFPDKLDQLKNLKLFTIKPPGKINNALKLKNI